MKFLHDFPKGEPEAVIEETGNGAKFKEEPLSKQRKVDVKQKDGKEKGSRGGMFRVGNPAGERGGVGRCDKGTGGLSSGARGRGVVVLTRMLPGRVELKRSESNFS